jgi:glycogen synthase kinase 3 beta
MKFFTKPILNENTEKYFLFRKIYDEGAFGGESCASATYAARIKTTTKVVSVKVIKCSTKSDLYRAENEIRILKFISKYPHPSITTLKDHYTRKIRGATVEACFVLDYFPSTLQKIMGNYALTENYMPISMVKVYCFQLFRALAHIHSFHICLRNLRPKSIAVNPYTRQLVINDFSDAKRVKKYNILLSSEKDEEEHGPVHLRAPEIICDCDETNGFAGDVWAAGCILADCVMNCDLFAGDSVNMVYSEHTWVSLFFSDHCLQLS